MLGGPAAGRLERFLRRGEAGHVARVGGGVVFDEQASDGAESRGDRFVHGAAGLEGGLLLDRCEREAGRAPHAPVVRLRAALDELQQARLAGAVAADEAHALAGLEDEVGAIEQRDMAESEARGGELDERHFGGDERSAFFILARGAFHRPRNDVKVPF